MYIVVLRTNWTCSPSSSPPSAPNTLNTTKREREREKRGNLHSYMSTSRIQFVLLIIIGIEPLGQGRFDQRERGKNWNKKNHVIYAILKKKKKKKKNRQSFIIEWQVENCDSHHIIECLHILIDVGERERDYKTCFFLFLGDFNLF